MPAVSPPPRTVAQRLQDTATLWSDWIQANSLAILVGLLCGALLVALLYGLKRLGEGLSEHPNQWRSVLGRALTSMRPWFMLTVALEIVISSGDAPEQIARWVHILFVVAASLQAAIFLRELILGTIELRAGGPDASGDLGNAIGLIRLLVSVGLFVVAIILILSNIGVNVTGLLAGLGIGGIAIGLAAQGIFSDLFAALAIILDKPFRRGETVAFETFSGTVEYIGLKSTRLRAVTGEMIVVSNTNLLAKVLRNTSRVEHRRVVQPLALTYQTPIDTCEALPALLRATIDAIPRCRFIRCGLENFAAASIEFKLVYELEGNLADDWLGNQSAVNLAILKLFEAEGIRFATPA